MKAEPHIYNFTIDFAQCVITMAILVIDWQSTLFLAKTSD